VSGATVIKYYFFGGQRHPKGTRMKQGSTLTYLHSDRGPWYREKGKKQSLREP